MYNSIFNYTHTYTSVILWVYTHIHERNRTFQLITFLFSEKLICKPCTNTTKQHFCIRQIGCDEEDNSVRNE